MFKFVWVIILVIIYLIWTLFAIADIKRTLEVRRYFHWVSFENLTSWWIACTIGVPIALIFVISICSFAEYIG